MSSHRDTTAPDRDTQAAGRTLRPYPTSVGGVPMSKVVSTHAGPAELLDHDLAETRRLRDALRQAMAKKPLVERTEMFPGQVTIGGYTPGELGFKRYDPEEGYEKEVYDVILHDGQLLVQCYPNAGFFSELFGRQRRVHETNVAYVRLYPDFLEASSHPLYP